MPKLFTASRDRAYHCADISAGPIGSVNTSFSDPTAFFFVSYSSSRFVGHVYFKSQQVTGKIFDLFEQLLYDKDPGTILFDRSKTDQDAFLNKAVPSIEGLLLI